MNIRVATEADKQKVFALRFEVFVDEQKVSPDIELDEADSYATHFICEEDGFAVGCARVIIEGGDAHIGRVAVKRSHRKCGVGAAVCRFAIDYSRSCGAKHFWLHAQTQARGFYEKLGFVGEGDIFMEDGIEHIRMTMDAGI